MTILVRCKGNILEVISGHRRLTAQLRIDGKAAVTDIETNQVLEVHEVDGEILVLQSPADAAAESIAHRAITKALDAAKKE
jgi:hypothetical protein